MSTPLFSLNVPFYVHDDYYLLRSADVLRSRPLQEFVQSQGWTLNESLGGYELPRAPLPAAASLPPPPFETM